tara:strand:+ start:374 stop:532 length:159 start_codon:yes stop_codon:yes gene_type:complete
LGLSFSELVIGDFPMMGDLYTKGIDKQKLGNGHTTGLIGMNMKMYSVIELFS